MPSRSTYIGGDASQAMLAQRTTPTAGVGAQSATPDQPAANADVEHVSVDLSKLEVYEETEVTVSFTIDRSTRGTTMKVSWPAAVFPHTAINGGILATGDHGRPVETLHIGDVRVRGWHSTSLVPMWCNLTGVGSAGRYSRAGAASPKHLQVNPVHMVLTTGQYWFADKDMPVLYARQLPAASDEYAVQHGSVTIAELKQTCFMLESEGVDEDGQALVMQVRVGPKPGQQRTPKDGLLYNLCMRDPDVPKIEKNGKMEVSITYAKNKELAHFPTALVLKVLAHFADNILAPHRPTVMTDVVNEFGRCDALALADTGNTGISEGDGTTDIVSLTLVVSTVAPQHVPKPAAPTPPASGAPESAAPTYYPKYLSRTK